MSWVDILLFLSLIAIVFLCFSFGLIKVASVLLAMYLGIQVAALFYKLFAGLTADNSNVSSVQTNQVIWFGLLWVVCSIIFSLVVMSFTKHYVLPQKWGNLDQVGGLVLGIIAGVFGILIFAYVIRNTATLAWFSAGKPSNYLYTIIDGFQSSLLMNAFRAIKTVLVNFASPWLPSDLPVFRDNF